MPTMTYAGTDVTVNDEGFFTDPDQRREDMAADIARAAGVDTLTEQHWQITGHPAGQGHLHEHEGLFGHGRMDERD